MIVACRAAARQAADLVHANWLAGAAVALFAAGRSSSRCTARERPAASPTSRSPSAHRASSGCCSAAPAPSSAAPSSSRTRCAVAGWRTCTRSLRRRVPDDLGAEDDPATVLFAGRLSPEKNIDVIAEATEGLPRIIAGDGPLRALVPDALGFVSQRGAVRALQPRCRGRARLQPRRAAERRARGDGARQDRDRDARRRHPDADRGRRHRLPRPRRRRRRAPRRRSSASSATPCCAPVSAARRGRE